MSDSTEGHHSSDPQPDAEFSRSLYMELRGMAEQRLRGERADHTLQPTALAHEAWARLSTGDRQFEDPREFLASAAQAMRRILIDHARGRNRVKRGGPKRQQVVVPLDAVAWIEGDDPLPAMDLEQALDRLEKVQPDAFRVLQARFFAGLTREQTAALLEISPRVVDRLWTFSRAWLQKELDESDGADG